MNVSSGKEYRRHARAIRRGYELHLEYAVSDLIPEPKDLAGGTIARICALEAKARIEQRVARLTLRATSR
jgi:hypothetical protein